MCVLSPPYPLVDEVLLSRATHCGYLWVFELTAPFPASEGREEGAKQRERNISVWLPFACPPLGTWPTTQACALTGNLTANLFSSQAGAQCTEPHQERPFPASCRNSPSQTSLHAGNALPPGLCLPPPLCSPGWDCPPRVQCSHSTPSHSF